jgi:hypothetical protein
MPKCTGAVGGIVPTYKDLVRVSTVLDGWARWVHLCQAEKRMGFVTIFCKSYPSFAKPKIKRVVCVQTGGLCTLLCKSVAAQRAYHHWGEPPKARFRSGVGNDQLLATSSYFYLDSAKMGL